MKKKVLIFIFLLSFILVFIFIKFEYKSGNWGNNINISDNNNILNISSYETTAVLEVHSNKNVNKYKINQKYAEPNILKMEILEPESIKGLTITCDGENTKIENKLLNINALYDNLNYKFSTLSLISFINCYKKGIDTSLEENENETIMQAKIDVNKYQMYQKLYIDKKTNLPTKMEILDINKNITVYILYNEIKINKTSKDDIL